MAPSISSGKFVSIDIETTGLDLGVDILEVAMVVHTDLTTPILRLPSLVVRIEPRPVIGDLFAFNMNKQLISEIIGKVNPFPSDVDFYQVEGYANAYGPIVEFLRKHFSQLKKIVPAGKNVMGFDMPLLNEKFNGIKNLFSHRGLDPGPLYYSPLEDEVPPSLSECKVRTGYPDSVTHRALDDARDVVFVLRKYWRDRYNVGEV